MRPRPLLLILRRLVPALFTLCRWGEIDPTGAKHGIVIGGEVLSKVVDWQDRSTAVLFGDRAAGVLLSDHSTYPLIEKEVLAADGTPGDSLTSGYRLIENPYYQDA